MQDDKTFFMKSKNPSIFYHFPTTSGSNPLITQRPLSFSNFHRDPQVIQYQLVFYYTTLKWLTANQKV